MELFSLLWFTSLVQIIGIDLVLAGDNAVVIAMAARGLQPDLQRKAVIFGTLGAILVRIILAVFAVALLKFSWVSAVGGFLLYIIAYRLASSKFRPQRQEKNIAAQSFMQAMWIVILADTVMGMDNVIAIAGAARGDILLVAIGLVVSIPIVMWGSFILISWIEKHHWIVYLGVWLLCLIGSNMIITDIALVEYFTDNKVLTFIIEWVVPAMAPFCYLFYNQYRRRNNKIAQA